MPNNITPGAVERFRCEALTVFGPDEDLAEGRSAALLTACELIYGLEARDRLARFLSQCWGNGGFGPAAPAWC